MAVELCNRQDYALLDREAATRSTLPDLCNYQYRYGDLLVLPPGDQRAVSWLLSLRDLISLTKSY